MLFFIRPIYYIWNYCLSFVLTLPNFRIFTPLFSDQGYRGLPGRTSCGFLLQPIMRDPGNTGLFNRGTKFKCMEYTET